MDKTQTDKVLQTQTDKVLQTQTDKVPQTQTEKVPQTGEPSKNFEQPLETTENTQKRKDSERKALYVAMTRTYRNLYVMYSGDLPFPLSNESLSA